MTEQWTCYLIYSVEKHHTYIGSTNNFPRRLIDHNSMMKSRKGAKRTCGQTWLPILIVTGFETKNACLSFESGWKRLSRNRCKSRLDNLCMISISYTKDPMQNRVIDLLYFLYNTTYVEGHYRLDPLCKKYPLFTTDLLIESFLSKELLDICWPSHVSVTLSE